MKKHKRAEQANLTYYIYGLISQQLDTECDHTIHVDNTWAKLLLIRNLEMNIKRTLHIDGVY